MMIMMMTIMMTMMFVFKCLGLNSRATVGVDKGNMGTSSLKTQNWRHIYKRCENAGVHRLQSFASVRKQ